MRNGFSMGRAPARVLGGCPQILHRPLGVPPALKMDRKFGRDVRSPCPIALFLPRAKPSMQRYPACPAHVRIQDIPIERVRKAFVVQFRAEAQVHREPCAGQVEHVVSGQAVHFSSLEELLAFMARVLTEGCTEPGNSPAGGGPCRGRRALGCGEKGSMR